jgi:alpha-L-arabinofuranosidase
VRDNKTGETIVKIVNGEGDARSVTIRLAGAKNLPATAERTVFGGADAETVNTDDAPPAVVPRTETIPLSAEFECEAPAKSLTILRFANR